MEIIRLLHIRHYDRRKQRFTSPAFKNFGNGISVIDQQCISNSGRTICEHIIAYYQSVASEPPIFWQFSSDILPQRSSIVPEVSTTGDICHYNIQGLSDKQARQFFKEYCCGITQLLICRPDGNCCAPSLQQLQQLSIDIINI